MKGRALEPQDVVALIDTREQLALDLAPMRVRRATLDTGDYSVAGLEHHIALERKSLSDLLMCIGQERDRFERELKRLQAYPVRAVVVEATWADLHAGGWRSRVTPAAAVGSVLGWVGQGIPFLFVGSHDEAGRAVARLLFLSARRAWRQVLTFAATVQATEPAVTSEVDPL
jgi:DNA excision repair protein ERCC-4